MLTSRHLKSIRNVLKSIFATEFIVPLLNTEGMSAVTAIEIKKTGDADYTDILTLTKYQVPTFDVSNITITLGN